MLYYEEAEHLVHWEKEDASGQNNGRYPNRN
jgi:hypothetical protein